MTHEEGIDLLADTILAERLHQGGEEGWLVAKFTDVANTWAASGWSSANIETGLEKLCVAVDARVAAFIRGLPPAPPADPIAALRDVPPAGSA